MTDVITRVPGLVAPVAEFGLFYLGDQVFRLDRQHLQTMMYLLLSVAEPVARSGRSVPLGSC